MATEPHDGAGRREGIFSPPNVVLILLCAMYAINYIVRVNVSTAAPFFKEALHLSNTQFGKIFAAFAPAYLVCQIFGGWFGDRLGARRALTLFAIIWSVATLLMGLANGFTGMLLGRLLLGLGVSALPTATQAMSAWMPPARRGFAQGITHSAARLGNAFTPPLVVWLIALVTWRGQFMVLGLVGLVWAAVWAWYFRDNPADHKKITAGDLEKLPPYASQAARKKDSVPLLRLIRRMFVVTVVYFCYGWTLWLYLSWIPSFFRQSFKLSMTNVGWLSMIVYFAGAVGNAAGGYVSDRIFHRTGDSKKARRDLIVAGFLCGAVCMTPLLFVQNLMIAATCLSLAFFFAEFTVGPFWAVPMDIAPRYSGSASGLMNTCSALAAIISPVIFGYVVDKTGSWQLPFVGSIALLLFGSILAFWIKPEERLAGAELAARGPAVAKEAAV